MMTMPFRKHCTDEQLLGHLDGELSRVAESSVSRHLKRCWDCRRRLAELEEQVQSVSRLLKDAGGLEERGARARRTFRVWQEQYEHSLQAVPRFGLLSSREGRKEWVLAGAVLVVCLVAGGFWLKNASERAQLTRVLAETRQYEQSLYQQARVVQHVFDVEVAEVRPGHRTRVSRVEVVSKPDEGRFAARWRDASGVLRRALWRPGGDREYRYDAAQALAVGSPASAVQTIALTDLPGYGLELEQIENGFMQWVAGQRWRPISLAAEFMTFSSQAGVILRAEPLQVPGQQPALRVSAERKSGDVSITLVMDVDSLTYRPRFHRMRFASRLRTVELHLCPLRAEPVRTESPLLALFEPEVPIAPQSATSALARLVPPAHLSKDVPRPVEPQPEDESPLIANELRARYALHRARACVSEPMEIRREASFIKVRGFAKTAERKRELITTLQSIPGVVVDIQTLEEALAKEASFLNRADVELPGESAATEVRASRLPIHAWLKDYFEASSRERGTIQPGNEAAGANDEIRELSNRAILLAGRLWSEAKVVRRLVEQYPPRVGGHLSSESKRLLESMIQDHLAELKSFTTECRQLLEPVLSSFLKDKNFSAAGPQASGLPESLETELPELSGQLVTVCEDSKRLIFGLFAGVDLAEGQEKEAIRRLLGNLAGLDRALRRFGVAFSAVPSGSSARLR